MDSIQIPRSARQAERQRPRASDTELERLLASIEVSLVKWVDYQLNPGESRSFAVSEMPTLQYALAGDAELKVANQPPIPIASHCLIIVPPRHPFSIGARRSQRAMSFDCMAERLFDSSAPTGVTGRSAVDSGSPQIKLVGGCFRACYGWSVDLFARLAAPIVERFDDDDQLDEKLRSAHCELHEQQVGAGVVTEALLKQVLVMLLRRSLKSPAKWIERFALFGDPQIARALADMVAHPEAAHSVDELSRAAGRQVRPV
jgi:AraC family transcriptional activator of mtrCDE